MVYSKRKKNQNKVHYKCGFCAKEFVTYYQRSKHMKIHTNGNPFKCEVCGKEFSSQVNVKLHMSVHTGEKPHKCDICGKTFTQKCNVKMHMFTHSGEKPFKCDICGHLFAYKFVLEEHMSIHTGEKLHQCKICDKRFARPSYLQTHMSIHSGEKPFKCEICGKGFAHRSYVRKHKVVHFDRRPYKCDKCEKTFLRRTDLKWHWLVHAPQKTYRCKECGKEFAENCELKTHSLFHVNQKSLKCDFCKKEFVHQDQLISHMFIHTQEKMFKCNICFTEFTDAGEFSRHMTIHTEQKFIKTEDPGELFEKALMINVTPYDEVADHKCEICGKQFQHRLKYRIHMKGHRKIKQHVCEICGKKFLQRTAMKNHLRVHTGEKHHKCDICDKYFSSKGNLKLHISRHKGEKSLKCEICNKTFLQRACLNSHILTHFKNKPFKCGVCWKQFSRQNYLKSHMLKHAQKREKPKCKICGLEFVASWYIKKHMAIHAKYGSVLATDKMEEGVSLIESSAVPTDGINDSAVCHIGEKSSINSEAVTYVSFLDNSSEPHVPKVTINVAVLPEAITNSGVSTMEEDMYPDISSKLNDTHITKALQNKTTPSYEYREISLQENDEQYLQLSSWRNEEDNLCTVEDTYSSLIPSEVSETVSSVSFGLNIPTSSVETENSSLQQTEGLHVSEEENIGSPDSDSHSAKRSVSPVEDHSFHKKNIKTYSRYMLRKMNPVVVLCPNESTCIFKAKMNVGKKSCKNYVALKEKPKEITLVNTERDHGNHLVINSDIGKDGNDWHIEENSSDGENFGSVNAEAIHDSVVGNKNSDLSISDESAEDAPTNEINIDPNSENFDKRKLCIDESKDKVDGCDTQSEQWFIVENTDYDIEHSHLQESNINSEFHEGENSPGSSGKDMTVITDDITVNKVYLPSKKLLDGKEVMGNVLGENDCSEKDNLLTKNMSVHETNNSKDDLTVSVENINRRVLLLDQTLWNSESLDETITFFTDPVEESAVRKLTANGKNVTGYTPTRSRGRKHGRGKYNRKTAKEILEERDTVRNERNQAQKNVVVEEEFNIENENPDDVNSLNECDVDVQKQGIIANTSGKTVNLIAEIEDTSIGRMIREEIRLKTSICELEEEIVESSEMLDFSTRYDSVSNLNDIQKQKQKKTFKSKVASVSKKSNQKRGKYNIKTKNLQSSKENTNDTTSSKIEDYITVVKQEPPDTYLIHITESTLKKGCETPYIYQTGNADQQKSSDLEHQPFLSGKEEKKNVIICRKRKTNAKFTTRQKGKKEPEYKNKKENSIKSKLPKRKYTCRKQQKKKIKTKKPLYSCTICKKSFAQKTKLTKHKVSHRKPKSFKCEICGKVFPQQNNVTNHMVLHTGEKPHECTVCDRTFAQKSSLKNHMLTHTGDKHYTCDICARPFAYRQVLEEHMLIHTGDKSYQCKVCDKRFARPSYLSTHMLAIHSGEKPYKCEICGKAFAHRSYVRKHKVMHFDHRPHKCEYCGKGFLRRTDLKGHWSVHKLKEINKCNICDKEFAEKCELKTHVLLHEVENSFQCEFCHVRFRYQEDLISHLSVHTEKKSFKCLICQTKFQDYYKFRRHMVTRHAVKLNDYDTTTTTSIESVFTVQNGRSVKMDPDSHRCGFCGKFFPDRFLFRVHMKGHRRLRQFNCEVCGKAFKQRSGLDNHMTVHTGDKPHQCDVCGLRFTQRGNLKTHSLKHSKEKTLKCEICGKKFSQRSTLNSHILSHSDDKPFKCGLCWKQFTRRMHLTRHMLTHSEVKDGYKCNICGQSFKQKSLLDNHMNIHKEQSLTNTSEETLDTILSSYTSVDPCNSDSSFFNIQDNSVNLQSSGCITAENTDSNSENYEKEMTNVNIFQSEDNMTSFSDIYSGKNLSLENEELTAFMDERNDKHAESIQ